MIKIIFYICFFLFSFNLFSQTRVELENKRKSSLKDIQYTNKLLNINATNTKSSYNKLLLLNSKITTRKAIINSITDEIQYLNSSIEIHQEILIGLENDLKSIKEEYARIIYSSFLIQNKYDKVMFIIASDNINTAFKRLKYFQQYTDYRKDQALRIENTKNEIGDKISEIAILKFDRNTLLQQEQSESQKLLSEKKQKSIEFKQYKHNEKELKLKLKKQNRIAARLQKEIARIIEEEARKAAERLKSKNGNVFQLTPEEKLLSSNFEKNRNKLPWPTVRGVVTVPFGEQPHPFLKGIKIRNDGVDISTTEGSIVRAIFAGSVSGVFAINGAHKTVIIRHGNYLSVYSNLKDVIVKQGDIVSTKQTIGVVYTENDKDHKTVLQFQIWKDFTKLNPTIWLANGTN